MSARVPGRGGRRALLVATAAALAAPRRAAARPVPPEATDAPTLLTALRSGEGLVGVLRHAATDRSQADTGRLDDRSGQRNLSAAGVAQARAVGEALRALGVPVARVATSAVFRARDTADLAFGPGAAAVEPWLLADDYARSAAEVAANTRALAGAISTPTGLPGLAVLVGHIVPLGLATGAALSQSDFPEGSLAVFRPLGGGRSEWLGTLTAEALVALARRGADPAAAAPVAPAGAARP